MVNRIIRKTTLYKKIILLVMGFILIFGASSIILVKELVNLYLEKELKEKGLSISRNLAETCIEPIIVEEIVKLQKQILETKRLEKDIVYIFIVDNQDNVIVHTFGDFFPKGLKDIDRLGQEEFYHLQILKTEDELIQNIAWPILGGNLGEVHVGMSYKSIQDVVSSIIYKLVGIMSILILGCGALFYFFTVRALYPLKIITEAIKEIGEGNFKQRIQIKSRDEIGLLAKSFNEMAENLEQTNRELKNVQSQLIQSGKMSALGQFAAGIAHEINNPLGAIINYIRTAIANPEIKGQNRGYLELTLKGLFRIENIVRQILSYSVRQKFEPQPTNVNKLITESLSFAQHKLLEHNIEINLNLDKSLPEILIEPNHIQQVFVNIINNAVDAISSKGKLIIETSFNNREVRIKFIDNGGGIKKEYLDKVFDPFFSTKEVGEGTGLGLFISYSIIQVYKGTINIESEEGKGTAVIITLPREVTGNGKL